MPMLTENGDVDAIRTGLHAAVSHIAAPPDLLTQVRQRHARHQRAIVTSVLAVVLFASGLAIGSETLGRTEVIQFKHVDLSQYSAKVGSIPSNERVSTTIVLRQGQLTISPAPEAESPAVSQQSALASWLSHGPAPVSGGAAPTSVLFGLLTDKEYATIQPNGSSSPIYVQHPTWIIEYLNAEVPISGGYVPGGSQGRPTLSVGPLYGFIDAASGSYLYAVSQTVPVPNP